VDLITLGSLHLPSLGHYEFILNLVIDVGSKPDSSNMGIYISSFLDFIPPGTHCGPYPILYAFLKNRDLVHYLWSISNPVMKPVRNPLFVFFIKIDFFKNTVFGPLFIFFTGDHTSRLTIYILTLFFSKVTHKTRNNQILLFVQTYKYKTYEILSK
jgi:hypothetical protein